MLRRFLGASPGAVTRMPQRFFTASLTYRLVAWLIAWVFACHKLQHEQPMCPSENVGLPSGRGIAPSRSITVKCTCLLDSQCRSQLRRNPFYVSVS